MLKSFFIFSLVVVSYLQVIAQDSLNIPHNNALYFELGGNGTILSANYERIVYQKNNLRLCPRIGCGMDWDGLSNLRKMPDNLLPLVEANLLSGRSKKFFETGFVIIYCLFVWCVLIFSDVATY